MASAPDGGTTRRETIADPRVRRRVGMALTFYGLAGLALLGFSMAFVLGAFDGGRGPLGLDATRRQLVELLDSSSQILADAETAARDADNSLAAAGSAATSGSHFTADLGTTLHNLATSLRISILGSQPFAGSADGFDKVAGEASAVAADLDRAAASITQGAGDMGSLAVDLGRMRAHVNTARSGLADTLDTGRWRLLGAAILAWLGVPALVSLWLGLRWWRPGSVSRSTTG
jgi:hypothetical protein